MKRENKLKQQTDTNRCLTGRATVDSAWKTSKTMLPLWRASGHPRQKRAGTQRSSRKAAPLYPSWKLARNTVFSVTSGVHWPSLNSFQPETSSDNHARHYRAPQKGPCKQSRNKQTGNTQRHFTGSQHNWDSAALQGIKENTHDPTRGWWKISTA